MSRLTRRLLALSAVLALVALPATGAAAATPEGVGTASTKLDLLKLEINGLPVVSDTIPGLDLGSLFNYASTDTDAARNTHGNGEPFALAQLLVAGGQEYSARSDGNKKAGGESAALPAGLGSLTVGNMKADVVDGVASSVIEALNGSLGGVLGLGISLPEAGAVATANKVQTLAQDGVHVDGLEVNLGDLLPADLLGALDLGSLLGLLGDLGLTDLQLRTVVSQLETTLTELDSTTDQLLSLGSASAITEAIKTLDATLGTTTEDSVEEVKSVLRDTCSSVGLSLCEGTKLDDANTIEEVQQLADIDLDALTSLLGTLDGLVAQLDGILAGLNLDDLLGGLLDQDLVAIDKLTVGVRAVAGQDGDATALCNAGGVRVLGLAAPVEGCDALKSAVSGLPGKLTGVLDNLPIVGGALDGVVSVGGLEIVEERGTDGAYETARAAITPLSVKVDLSNLKLGLDAIDGDLLGVVNGLVDELGLVQGLLPASQQSYQAQNASRAQAAPSVAGLNDLTGALEGLLGGNLGALQLPSLELAGPGLSGDADYTVAGTTPQAPAAPTPDSNLPRTGGGLGMGLMGALLGAAGAATWWTRRRMLGVDG